MAKPAVIITVSGGVADYTRCGDVEVVLIDYDNLEDESTTRSEIEELMQEVMLKIPDGGDIVNQWKGNALAALEEIADGAIDDRCPNCCEPMDKDCEGTLRCPTCDDPCPSCHDGGGP